MTLKEIALKALDSVYESEIEAFAEDAKFHLDGRKCRAKKRCPYQSSKLKPVDNGFFVNLNLTKEITDAANIDRTKGDVWPRRRPIALSSTPSLWRRCGIGNGIVLTTTDIVRKCIYDHAVKIGDFADLPNLYSHPAAIICDPDGCFMIITDRLSETKEGGLKPLMVYLKPVGDKSKHNFIASTYPRETNKESAYVSNARAGGVMFVDKNKIAKIGLEEATYSHIQTSI